MQPLEAVMRNIRAAVETRGVLGELLGRVFRQLEEKKIDNLVPQHSIDRVHQMAKCAIMSQDNKCQDSAMSPSQEGRSEPSPVFVDKLIAKVEKREKALNSLNQLNKVNQLEQCSHSSDLRKANHALSTRKEEPKYKIRREDSRTASQKAEKENPRLEFSSMGAQLNFQPSSHRSKHEEDFRKRKGEEKRKWKDETPSILNQTNKSAVTEKEANHFVYPRREFTYDENGGVIPILKFERSNLPKLEVNFEVQEKPRERLNADRKPLLVPKCKLRKPEIRLDEARDYFCDVRSPFLGNFELQHRQPEERLKEAPDKVYSSELPNYMRILTQEGGIKKRYARYKTEKAEGESTRQIFKECTSRRESSFRIGQKRNSECKNPLQLAEQEENELRIPRLNKIKIVSEALRRRVIENDDRVSQNRGQNKLSGMSKKLSGTGMAPIVSPLRHARSLPRP